MAKARVGINGFGRIGRLALKTLLRKHSDTLDVVAINDLLDTKTNAHLFKYDSNYGPHEGTVEARENSIVIDGNEIAITAQRDPGQIPWKKYGVDIVVESTGFFTDATKAKAHIDAGAKKVIISAPARHEDITVVLGVNEEKYDPKNHHVISNASCTTNGLAPVAKILYENYGIAKGFLTTVHSYTNSQRLLDVATSDLRDARAAALNIVPAATGAARAVALVIPELQGKFGGMAFRVPTPTVSVIDFTAVLEKKTNADGINAAMQEAADGPLKGILQYTEEPLVSMDLKGNEHSSIFSGMDTMMIGDDFCKVISWYDNEWGYANRLADITAYVAERLGA
jgi:glyceraldehyde 3-phosphate dehydrogenase